MADSREDTAQPRVSACKTQLVSLIAQNGTDLFHSPDGQAYATVTIGQYRKTMDLRSRAFSEYLSREYYNTTKKVPSGNDLKDAIRVLTASAVHFGAELDVFTRIARVGATLWLDLGTQEGVAVKITKEGWSIELCPSVKFRRSRGLLALPVPVRRTDSLVNMLKKLINITDPMLLIAWLIGVMRGQPPCPILAVYGEQGTAKSTTCRYLRRLIDPNTADLRIPPKEPRDIVIAASNSLILAYDNLSRIDDWLSDALCSLSTGGGFGTRALFSDGDEVLFRAARPIILNGIGDVVARPDLLDRALVVTLDPIPADRRRSEVELDAEFRQAHPAILAALLDAVVLALRHETTTRISELPRMADFATWIVAAETEGEGVLGWPPGTFLPAYRANQQDAVESVLDGDVVADAIQALPFLDGVWSGQLKELLDQIPAHEHKPKSPRGLRAALTRKAPALRGMGVTIAYTRGHVKKVEIRRAIAHEEPSF